MRGGARVWVGLLVCLLFVGKLKLNCPFCIPASGRWVLPYGQQLARRTLNGAVGRHLKCLLAFFWWFSWTGCVSTRKVDFILSPSILEEGIQVVFLVSYKHLSVQRGTILSQDYQRSTALLQEELGKVAEALCEVLSALWSGCQQWARCWEPAAASRAAWLPSWLNFCEGAAGFTKVTVIHRCLCRVLIKRTVLPSTQPPVSGPALSCGLLGTSPSEKARSGGREAWWCGYDPGRTSADCTEKVEWGETTSPNGSLF